MKATLDQLQEMHGKIAAAYLRILNSVDGVCGECGHACVQPVNPAILGHINKFLKDNNIDALPVPGSPLGKLQEKGKLVKLPYLEEHERRAVGE